MDDEIGKNAPRVQADNQSIAIGEINISGTVTGNITIGHTIVQPADARLRHELGILLKSVQNTWIKDVLEKSVHEAALLELGLELREEAVDHPWRMVIGGPDQVQETLPRGRKIKDIFINEANRLLLILGEPGSGKTTTLLQLARDLIAEVDSTFTQPVPVILHLSTWTNKAQPLDEWMIAELNNKYHVPKKEGQRWLTERRVLPLLDGLDEVRAENRAACVEKLNQLVTNYGLQGMVVCSRIKDYIALNVRLAFYRAIYIQPLTPEQVDEYLNEAGEKLASLRATLQADEALRSMAQSPLILNIMSLSYQNVSANDLSNPSLFTDKARLQHLFDTYVARMFSHKAGARPYNDEQTKQRLSWLARNMQRHNQEVFLIEGLQPSWFSERIWRYAYILVSRLFCGLSGGLIILLLAVILATKSDVSNKLIYALYLGLIVGFSLGGLDILRFELLHKWRPTRKASIFLFSIVNIMMICLMVGPMFWLFTRQKTSLIDALINIIFYGLITGLIFGPRASRQSLESDIQTVEALRWSWPNALASGLIGGLITGPIYALVGAWVYGWGYFAEDIFIGLLSGGLITAYFKGLRREIIETKSVPNHGIRLSIRNSTLSGLIGGLIGGPVIGYGFGQYPIAVLGIAVIFGLICALLYGGLDVIQHYTLRLLLLIQGHTPANYARFLDYAVDRIFLQKVGGGYRFIHRLLLEHFAEMGDVKKV